MYATRPALKGQHLFVLQHNPHLK